MYWKLAENNINSHFGILINQLILSGKPILSGEPIAFVIACSLLENCVISLKILMFCDNRGVWWDWQAPTIWRAHILIPSPAHASTHWAKSGSNQPQIDKQLSDWGVFLFFECIFVYFGVLFAYVGYFFESILCYHCVKLFTSILTHVIFDHI